MLTMVCFEAAGSTYCVPLHATRFVRTADDLVSLPDPAAGVVGVLRGEPPLTVISPLKSELNSGGRHVLVMETNDKSFGLLVDVVTGIEQFDEAAVRPAPDGQDSMLVSATLEADDRLVLVADPNALAGQL